MWWTRHVAAIAVHCNTRISRRGTKRVQDVFWVRKAEYAIYPNGMNDVPLGLHIPQTAPRGLTAQLLMSSGSDYMRFVGVIKPFQFGGRSGCTAERAFVEDLLSA